MALYDNKYIQYCQHMIGLNQEQVNEWEKLILAEEDPAEKKWKKEELQGWIKWLNFWKQELQKALTYRAKN